MTANTEQPDNPQPPSLDEVKASVVAHHEAVVKNLTEARSQRDYLQARIKVLVQQEAEAARMVSALTPRKPKGGK